MYGYCDEQEEAIPWGISVNPVDTTFPRLEWVADFGFSLEIRSFGNPLRSYMPFWCIYSYVNIPSYYKYSVNIIFQTVQDAMVFKVTDGTRRQSSFQDGWWLKWYDVASPWFRLYLTKLLSFTLCKTHWVFSSSEHNRLEFPPRYSSRVTSWPQFLLSQLCMAGRHTQLFLALHDPALCGSALFLGDTSLFMKWLLLLACCLGSRHVV